MTAAPDPEWTSLDVVRAELDLEAAAQAKRGESADSRAGVVLGAAGALAGLAVNAKTVFALPGALASLAAAILAARVMFPRLRNAINPVEVRLAYVTRAQESTKRQMLDNRVSDYAVNEEVITAKVGGLRVAIVTLVGAVSLVVGGVGLRLVLNAIG